MLCWRLPQLSGICGEEKSSNGGIAEVLLPYATKQPKTWCYKGKPNIEILLPSVPGHPTGRSPSSANSQTLAPLTRLTDLKCLYMRSSFHLELQFSTSDQPATSE